MPKILVIEDHQDVRENIVEILELANYECLSAANGKEGVKLATQFPPDLIICDIMMPELDGYGVLHILNKREDTRHIPFIFLSAKSEKTDFRKGMSMGADDYLTKPFDDKELLQAIELRLDKRSAMQPVEATNDSINSLGMEKRLHASLEELYKSSEERTLRKKDTVFMEGDRSFFIYQVKSGSVKLFKTNEIGKEVILKIAGPGEFFGYLAVMNDGYFTESASAMETTVIRIISRGDFLKALYEKKEIASFLLHLMAGQISEAEDRLMKMAYNSVRKKVAEALLFVYKQKSNDDGSHDPVINILRDDLAGIAGTAKETAIRTLADFREEKLISISDRSIKLLNVKGLEELPN
jgi:CheY-like chemotaxis protein